MFPTQADFHFHLALATPKWYKGKTGIASVSIDAIVNSHAGIRIPNYIHNTLSLFRLWQSNRIREGVDSSPLAFMRYIVSSGITNQKERYYYCKRVIRKFNS